MPRTLYELDLTEIFPTEPDSIDPTDSNVGAFLKEALLAKRQIEGNRAASLARLIGIIKFSRSPDLEKLLAYAPTYTDDNPDLLDHSVDYEIGNYAFSVACAEAEKCLDRTRDIPLGFDDAEFKMQDSEFPGLRAWMLTPTQLESLGVDGFAAGRRYPVRILTHGLMDGDNPILRKMRRLAIGRGSLALMIESKDSKEHIFSFQEKVRFFVKVIRELIASGNVAKEQLFFYGHSIGGHLMIDVLEPLRELGIVPAGILRINPPAPFHYTSESFRDAALAFGLPPAHPFVDAICNALVPVTRYIREGAYVVPPADSSGRILHGLIQHNRDRISQNYTLWESPHLGFVCRLGRPLNSRERDFFLDVMPEHIDLDAYLRFFMGGQEHPQQSYLRDVTRKMITEAPDFLRMVVRLLVGSKRLAGLDGLVVKGPHGFELKSVATSERDAMEDAIGKLLYRVPTFGSGERDSRVIADQAFVGGFFRNVVADRMIERDGEKGAQLRKMLQEAHNFEHEEEALALLAAVICFEDYYLTQ